MMKLRKIVSMVLIGAMLLSSLGVSDLVFAMIEEG